MILNPERVFTFEEFLEALVRVSSEKWEEGEEGEQPIETKYGWILQSLKTLYTRLLAEEGVKALSEVGTTSKYIAMGSGKLLFQGGHKTGREMLGFEARRKR